MTEDSWRPPEEVEQERRTETAIKRYLAKPPVRRPQASDHNWSKTNLTCVDCGITKAAFYNKPIPCLKRG